jgi:hypothetical protein
MKELLEELQLCGVRILRTTEEEPLLTLDASGYTLTVPLSWDALPPEDTEPIIAHYATRIFRGDVLALDEEHPNTAVRLAAQEIAANRHVTLPPTLRRFIGFTEDTVPVRLYDNPLQKVGVPSWRWIERKLLQSGWQPQTGSRVSRGGNADQRIEAHLRTLMQAQRSLTSLNKLSQHVRGTGGHEEIVQVPKTEPDLQLLGLLRTLRLAKRVRGTVPMRARGWRRPGRLPCLRGIVRERRSRIVVLLDGSGSMDHWFPYAWSAVRQLAKTALPHVIIYSDRVLWSGRAAPPEHIEGLGGGTNIQPALDAAERLEPDLIVAYTDGEHEDVIRHPAAPIIWVIVPNGRLRPTHVRPKDKVIYTQKREDDSEAIVLE